ncbi:MAG: FtsB family cell division protein [Alphaproteobacteria bacterium]
MTLVGGRSILVGMFKNMSDILTHFFLPILGSIVVIYFVYHTVQGDRGVVSWIKIKSEISEAENRLTLLKTEKESLEAKTSLLRTDHLDLDLLEERTRKVLGYTYPDELIILEGQGN